MQTARIVQAVVLMSIVAVAASCAASKEYTSKLFAPRTPVVQDTPAVASLRFLEFEKEDDKAGWVTTDIITGRDTTHQTFALDKFSQMFPATATTSNPVKIEDVVKAGKSTAKADSAIAKNANVKAAPVKTTPAPVETKPVPVESEPVARYLNTEDVRTKRTREK